MARRNFLHASQMPTMDHDQIRNPPHHDPHSHLGAGNGSFMLHEDGAASAMVSRLSDQPSSSISNSMASNLGPLHDPYFHPSSSATFSRFLPDQGMGMPLPGFNQHGGGMVNPHAEIGRAAYKRKRPAVPQSYNGGSISGYYNAGSSSNAQMPFDLLPPTPISWSQYWSVNPASIIHGHRSDNHLTADEDSQRNMRHRHNHTIHPEIHPAVVYWPSNVPPHFHTGRTLLGISMDGRSHVQMPMASQGRNLSPYPCFNHEGSQPLAGPRVINTAVGSNVVLHPNLTHGRNSSYLPTLHDPMGRGMDAGGIGYYQRSNPHRASSSNASGGFSTAAWEGDGGPPIASSRYSRPLSMAVRSSHRNGRTRSSNSRFQSGYNEDAVHSRWSSEGSGIMDRSTYYDSRNWFDQHRDMRLDIHNMSYEVTNIALLALGERIGNVGTGLSEENIYGCLQEITHCSYDLSDDDQDEGKCAICLEEYKHRDRLGRLSCRHDFHACCIKTWLLIKNACPICKAAASSDSPKEKRT